MKNQRIAVAGDTITIPENTRVIIEGGVVVFESIEPIELEVGEWYEKDHWIVLKTRETCGVGFNNDTWMDTMAILSERWQPADPEEVTRLLVGEAEKRGFNYDSYLIHDDGVLHGVTNSFIDGWCFDSKTGKWAEIIEEKKPLYTNSYGTDWFEHDTCCKVRLSDEYIGEFVMLKKFGADNNWTEAMTKRECHLYVADKLK